MKDSEREDKKYEEHLRRGADILHFETFQLATDLIRRGDLLDTLLVLHNIMETYDEYYAFRKKPPTENR
jgi:hypothetical protein